MKTIAGTWVAGIVVLGFLGVGSLGCEPDEEQLRARAAFDLRCDQRKLEITEIDDKTRGVRGCGAQAAYVSHCDRRGCTWLLNADSRGADKPAE